MIIVDGEELSERGGIVEAKGSSGVEYRRGFLVDLLVHSEKCQLDLYCRLVFLFFKATNRLVFQVGIFWRRATDMFEVLDIQGRLHTRVSAAVGL